jgi:hypothetical protein
MTPRRNWDSPNPSPASECAPPHPWTKGWGAHSPAGGGWGSSNSEDWEKKLSTLPTLCITDLWMCVCRADLGPRKVSNCKYDGRILGPCLQIFMQHTIQQNGIYTKNNFIFTISCQQNLLNNLTMRKSARTGTLNNTWPTQKNLEYNYKKPLHFMYENITVLVIRRWGWLSREGWVAKSVARQLAMAALWVRIQTSLKNHKWAT